MSSGRFINKLNGVIWLNYYTWESHCLQFVD